MNILLSTAPLPSLCVDVVDRDQPAAAHDLKCEIGVNLKFDSQVIERYFFSNKQNIIEDLLLLIAAVEFCDRVKKRAEYIWGRNLHLKIPVFELDIWEQKEVKDALLEALSSLTGDRWSLKFKQRPLKYRPKKQNNLEIPPLKTKAIMPFSNGLDSFLVGKLMDKEYSESIQRFRLGMKLGYNKNTSDDVFLMTPFSVQGANLKENSVRSRGFKFSILTGIAAYLSGSEDVIIPESGQGSLGVALVPIGQAYPDYRNHPVFLKKMEKIIALVLDYKVSYKFPRIWHTKGETLKAYLELDSENNAWTKTRTCWQSPRQTSVLGRHRQCGICAACMLRRLSVNTAGVSEPLTNYVWENLSATSFELGAELSFRNKGCSSIMLDYAIAGATHMQELADFTNKEYARNSIDNTASKLSLIFNESKSDINFKLKKLLKNHKKEWEDFIKKIGHDSFITKWTAREIDYVT